MLNSILNSVLSLRGLGQRGLDYQKSKANQGYAWGRVVGEYLFGQADDAG